MEMKTTKNLPSQTNLINTKVLL